MYIISFYDLPQGCLAFNDWFSVQGRLKESTKFVLSKIPFDISFWKSQKKVNAVMIDFTKHSRRNFVIEFLCIWIFPSIKRYSTAIWWYSAHFFAWNDENSFKIRHSIRTPCTLSLPRMSPATHTPHHVHPLPCTPPAMYTPYHVHPTAMHAPPTTHALQILRDALNERAVCILLECNLVNHYVVDISNRLCPEVDICGKM